MRPANVEDEAIIAKNGVLHLQSLMRITGGTARSIPLKTPSGQATRPATDRMRESVFSSLGPRVEGAHCLDLFAGTGAYGLEALSRGAASVTFVEQDAKALRILESNRKTVLKSLGMETKHSTHIAKADVFQWNSAQPVDLIFVDPPYSLLEKRGRNLLEKLASWIGPSAQARIIFEAPGDWEPPEIESLECMKRLGKKGRNEPSAIIYKPLID